MVALDSHEGLAHHAVPVRLTPQPPGEWRWVGTRTLLFEPEGRFPMATGYRVEVRAGYAGPPAARSWRATPAGASRRPPPRLVGQYPEGVQRAA